MAEYIDREKLRQKMYQEAFVKDSDLQRWDSGCWIRYKLFENVLEKTEVADVQPVVRCKDCVYRPYYEPSDSKSVSDLVFPDYRFNPCPCRVEDVWYSWMPDDDWFCAYGKRKDGET